ncbi:MAG: branched-chain amino acid ABC transporter permease [Sciscionella sp.]
MANTTSSGRADAAPSTVRHQALAPHRAWRSPALTVALCGVLLTLLALTPFVLPLSALLVLQSVIGLALFASATNLLIGYAGLVSFGQAAFYGTGAYVVALLWLHLKLSFWVSFFLAPVAGALAALLVGLIALRTRRLYFALLTLAFSELFYVIAQQQYGFTGGDNGVFGAILPASLVDPLGGFYFTLAVATVCLLLLWKVTISPFGLTLRSIRENRERAEALGVNVYRHQLVAFVISGALCAVAGTLFVVHDQSAYPTLLDWTESGYPIFMAVIGGMFSFLGPVLGALLFEAGRDVIVAHIAYWQLIFGAILLLIVLFAPDGLTGLASRGWMRLRALRSRPAAAQPSDDTDDDTDSLALSESSPTESTPGGQG